MTPDTRPSPRGGDSPIIHNVKSHPAYFHLAWLKKKPFEIRVNDRDYRAGDRICQFEFDPETGSHHSDAIKGHAKGSFTGRYILSGIDLVFSKVPGVMPGYVILILDHVLFQSFNPAE